MRMERTRLYGLMTVVATALTVVVIALGAGTPATASERDDAYSHTPITSLQHTDWLAVVPRDVV